MTYIFFLVNFLETISKIWLYHSNVNYGNIYVQSFQNDACNFAKCISTVCTIDFRISKIILISVCALSNMFLCGDFGRWFRKSKLHFPRIQDVFYNINMSCIGHVSSHIYDKCFIFDFKKCAQNESIFYHFLIDINASRYKLLMYGLDHSWKTALVLNKSFFSNWGESNLIWSRL